MNILDKYLLVNKISSAKFGRTVDVDATTVHYWRKGLAKPTAKNAMKIHQATKGKVSLASFGYEVVESGFEIRRKKEKTCA